MIRDQAFALAVAASVADGLLDADDVEALAIPGHVQVLAGPGWGRQSAPDAEQPNGSAWYSGPAREALKRPVLTPNGPGCLSSRGRRVDLTRQLGR